MARNTPRPPAPRIPASAWWNAVTSQLVPIADAIKLAKRAEHRDLGHECGHEFTITSTVRGHSWVVGGSPETHCDALQDGDVRFTLKVRASSLRDALLVAAITPLHEWSGWDDDEPDAAGTEGAATDA